jgi:hypothetical protein
MSDAVVAPDLARVPVGLSPRNRNGLFVTAETSEVNEVQLEDAAHSADLRLRDFSRASRCFPDWFQC